MANKVTKASAKMQFPIKSAHSSKASPLGPVYRDASASANKVSTASAIPSFKLIPAIVKEPRPIE